MLRETLLALLALSLVFLNYGTAPIGEVIDGKFVVESVSLCGDTGAGGDASHAVCHACRPSPAVLPTPPEVALDACMEAIPVVYAPYVAEVASVPRFAGASSRGPPVIA